MSKAFSVPCSYFSTSKFYLKQASLLSWSGRARRNHSEEPGMSHCYSTWAGIPRSGRDAATAAHEACYFNTSPQNRFSVFCKTSAVSSKRRCSQWGKKLHHFIISSITKNYVWKLACLSDLFSKLGRHSVIELSSKRFCPSFLTGTFRTHCCVHTQIQVLLSFKFYN